MRLLIPPSYRPPMGGAMRTSYSSAFLCETPYIAITIFILFGPPFAHLCPLVADCHFDSPLLFENVVISIPASQSS